MAILWRYCRKARTARLAAHSFRPTFLVWLSTLFPFFPPHFFFHWRIEDWHRVLKSGCSIDELGHQSVERLERAIAVRMVIAWRVMLMTLLGRDVPELPAELLFSKAELRLLGDFAQTRRRPRPRPTQLGEAVILVAILGGYLNCNNDPPPGHQLMWHGYTKLAAMAMAYELRDEIEDQ